MGEKLGKEEAKGCFQFILFAIGIFILGVIFYAIIDGIQMVFDLIPWYLWILIIVVGIWSITKLKK
ncbi:MAG: hypothetical protein ACQEWD_16090 [Bacteroidota bacterium]